MLREKHRDAPLNARLGRTDKSTPHS